MYPLTLQIYVSGIWHDAMTLHFDDPGKGFEGSCRFGYEQDYLLNHLDALESPFCAAVSAKWPLSWDTSFERKAPAFLHDIAPAGAAKKFILPRIGQKKWAAVSTDLFLLGQCTPAPIGNMRIKQSVEALDQGTTLGFSRAEVIDRDHRFLEYAYEQGAAIGGATGAGGEAPKLLMTEDSSGLLYPDAVLDDAHAVRHWFVKFSRNQGAQTDQDILRSEYHYYRALQALEIATVAEDGLALEQAHRPSLWVRRFDRNVMGAGVERAAVESVYSLAEVTTPGSYMDHLEVIQMLAGLWRQAGQEDQVEDLVADYLHRDLLNKILGNSDNHGRNTAIIRTAKSFRMAPIYDLAPMVMDSEGVTRTTKWPRPLEVAGDIDWRGVCSTLGTLIDPDVAFERLRQDAAHLLALPDILVDSGLPKTTMDHPRVYLKHLGQCLRSWGLQQ